MGEWFTNSLLPFVLNLLRFVPKLPVKSLNMKHVIIFVILIAMPLHASADIIKLSSGKTIQGNVLSLKSNRLTVFEQGVLVEIDWQIVTMVSIDHDVYVNLSNEETLLGAVLLQNKKVCINSKTAGQVTVDKARIKALSLRSNKIDSSAGKEKIFMSHRGKGEKNLSDEEKHIGEKPENEEKPYLRETKIILEEGKFELAVGFTYVNDIENVFFFNEEYFGLAKSRIRQLSIPISVSYGIKDNLMATISIPFVSSFKEIYSGTDSNAGLGDISAGIFYQFKGESVNFPSLTLKGSVKSNSGDSPYDEDIPLGTGHWNVSTGLSAVKTYDPVSLFGSLSFTHIFAKNVNNMEIDPGDRIETIMGLGFAVNRDISMSFQLGAGFKWESRIDGDEVEAFKTPFTFRYKIDKILSKYSYIEPAIQFGLNDDAADVVFDLTYVQKF